MEPLLLHRKNSFVYVGGMHVIESINFRISKYERDFDVLEEPLGMANMRIKISIRHLMTFNPHIYYIFGQHQLSILLGK